MKKRILSIFLVLTMLVGIIAVLPISVGAAEGELTISDLDDWKTFQDNTSDYTKVKVDADELDFSSYSGSPQISGFSGTFDGQGVVLTGITLNTSNASETGLFCTVGGTIKNVVIKDSTFDNGTSTWSGSLACCTKGKTTVENVYICDDVTVKGGKDYVGGIIGGCGGSKATVTVRNCVFAGTADGTGNVGGIIGNGAASSSHSIVIENTLVIGKVSNTSPADKKTQFSCGFVGTNRTSSITLTNCVYAGGAEDYYYYSRPFFANAGSATVTNCYTIAKNSDDLLYSLFDGTEFDEGKEDFFSHQIKYFTTTENCGVTYVENVNDLIGCYASVLPVGWTTVCNGTNADIIVPEGVADFAPASRYAKTCTAPTTWVKKSDTSYEIGDAAAWRYFVELSKTQDFSGVTVTLTDDIILNEGDAAAWAAGDTSTVRRMDYPVCSGTYGTFFKGNFNGNGKTIYGAYIVEASNADGIGLFGEVNHKDNTGYTVEITNFSLENSYIEAEDWIGGIIGEMSGPVSVSNVYVGKDVYIHARQSSKSNNAAVGGIVGGMYNKADLSVDSCVVAATITSEGGPYSGGILGYGNNKSLKAVITNCLFVGTVTGCDDAWGIAGAAPESDDSRIENCVSIGTAQYAIGNFDSSHVVNCKTLGNGVELHNFVGANADVPSTFTKRGGDFAVPTAIKDLVPMLLTQQLIDGASIRLDEPTGIRFTALLGGDFLNSVKQANAGKTVNYGIIITPEDYVDEVDEFTIEELDKLNHSLNYLLAEASGENGQLLAGGESEGYYLFTGVLAEVQSGNYDRNFAARAYVSVDNGDGTVTYYYSDYDADVNSRSIEYVAEKAYNDTSTVKNDFYKYDIAGNSGTYSPYTQEQRELLPKFYGKAAASDTYFLSYNVRNLEDKNVLGNLYEVPTYEYTNRDKYVLEYLKSSGADVIGLQEVTKLTLGGQTLNWFDTLNGTGGLTDNGYSYYAGDDILPDDSKKDMWNPIYWNSTKFTESGKGCYDLGAYYAGTENEELRRLTWVKLTNNETGESFIYVNVHMPRVQSADGDGQKEAAVKLKEFIQAQFANETCPIIIGGDFNGSYSDYTTHDSYWGSTAVKARNKSTNQLNGCTTTTTDFTAISKPDGGPVDLYFAVNEENVKFHTYAVTDNKIYVTEKSAELYPSDHLPVKLIVTFYKNN